ncbi:MAG: D-glycerate dehydrogenase [Balneolaceae bacterium]|nr:D-glycerate dehydrogenase [Balneolaceae bacterium]
MSACILITEPIIQSVIDDLRTDYKVDVGKRGQFNTEQQLVDVIGDYDALLPMLSNPVTKNVIEAGEKLKIIANHAVGYNNIDLEAAQKAGVKVANTPDVLTESSADLAMGLLLSVARKIDSAQAYLRKGQFNGWEPLGFLGMELNRQTLGILGMGRIGTAVARRARAFGMNILYHNRSKVSAKIEQELNATYISPLKKLAQKSDILSLHCPLTDDTRHAIDATILKTLPDHAILINTSRGPVVDETALADALHNGVIGGAGLDVFEKEPDVHPRLLKAPNCVLTPHIASATTHTRKAIGELAANAIRGVLQGKPASEISNLLHL